jgi:hypothetical protein
MKDTKNSKVSKGLLGEGLVAVFGMPQRFDLALGEFAH